MILNDESFSVRFNSKKGFKDLDHSFCLPIKELIDEQMLDSKKNYSPKELIDNVKDKLLKRNENSLYLKLSYIHHHHVCFGFKSDGFSELLPVLFKYKFKIFIKLPNESYLYFFENVYEHNPFLNKSFEMVLTYVKISFLEYPYESNCTRFKGKHSSKEEYNKLNCLFDCYRSSTSNYTLYFYKYNEDVNLTLKEHEFKSNPNCSKLCSENDCVSRLLSVYLKYSRKCDKSIISSSIYAIEAVRSIGTFELWIQLISLVTLFLNISLHVVLKYLISKLKDKIQKMIINLKNDNQFKK